MKENTGKKILKWIGIILAVLVSAIGVLALLSDKWMEATWSEITPDELIFELTMPLAGTGSSMLESYAKGAGIPGAIFLAALVAVLILVRKHKKAFRTILALAVAAGLTCVGLAAYSAWNYLDMGEYVESHALADEASESGNDFIENNYVNPTSVNVTFPEQKRNLIYIYLESVEMTFADKADGGAWERSVIPELTTLAEENEDFSGADPGLNGGISLPGSTWTMGAMFAQTSGLPLQVSIGQNNMDTQETFFPGIITIGDLLAHEGYQQTLLIGSDATFGGRRLYFTEHGNYQQHDLFYAREQGWIPEDYGVSWGYEDEKLFAFAKEELAELAASGQPFNLTMLTVDTHFPNGYICDLCGDEFGDQYSNVYACSSKQVTEFVRWIQEQDFYENTTIVISGDHPTMDPGYTGGLDESYQRRVYTSYINAAAEPADPSRTREYSTFDDFPTTVAALGASIEGDRLGLGTNLFSTTDTLIEEYGFEATYKGLKAHSNFLNNIESVDENAEALQGRISGEEATADYIVETDAEDPSILHVRIENIQGTGDWTLDKGQLVVYSMADESDQQWYLMDPEHVDDGTKMIEANYDQNHYFTYDLDIDDFTGAKLILQVQLTDIKSTDFMINRYVYNNPNVDNLLLESATGLYTDPANIPGESKGSILEVPGDNGDR